MIECPHCDRSFEKRSGLQIHIGAAHPETKAVPVNPGGAIEPVVPVEEDEGYARSGSTITVPGDLSWEQTPYDQMTHSEVTLPPGAVIHLTPEGGEVLVPEPTAEQRKSIRSLVRAGRQRADAFEQVMGYPMPPEVVEPPVSQRLEHVRFRVRNSRAEATDVAFLLRLVDIGEQAIGELAGYSDGSLDRTALLINGQKIIEQWKAALQ